MFFKTGVIKNVAKFLGKHQCWKQSFKKETLAQVFSCEFCEIFKNSFFVENLRVAASPHDCFRKYRRSSRQEM